MATQAALRHQFFITGLQYYIVGRSAFFADSIPVTGNLFHHAIEMVLKHLLVSAHTPDELKNKFKHRLDKLWVAFKNSSQGGALGRYDKLISRINAMDELRYPPSAGYAFFMCLVKPLSPARQQKSNRISVEEHQLSLEEVDELMAELFRKSVPLNVLRDHLMEHGDSCAQYKRNNRHSVV